MQHCTTAGIVYSEAFRAVNQHQWTSISFTNRGLVLSQYAPNLALFLMFMTTLSPLLILINSLKERGDLKLIGAVEGRLRKTKALYSKTSLLNLPIGRRNLVRSRRSPAEVVVAHNLALAMKTGPSNESTIGCIGKSLRLPFSLRLPPDLQLQKRRGEPSSSDLIVPQ
jgi:hypothetical protein